MKLFLAILTLTLSAVSISQAQNLPSITIEALVDGPSSLHIRQKTIHWENGNNAKPGKWELLDEPTYVNGVAWMPRWRERKKDRGEDRSNFHNITLGTTDLNFELLAVSETKGGGGIQKRSPVATRKDKDEFIITITDAENGPRWYRFILTPKSK